MNPARRHRVVTLTGNLRRPSRTFALGAAIAGRLEARLDSACRHFDILDAGPGLGTALNRTQLSPEALAVVEAIEDADVLIAVSPVYKGSYSGMFKHLFDFVDVDALVGRPVLLAATGGGPRHSLMIEHQMRPLFSFFSALIVPTAVYAEDADFEGESLTDPGVLARIDAAAGQCADLARAIGPRRDRAGSAEAAIPVIVRG